MKKLFLCFFLCLLFAVNLQAQDISLLRVEPPSWWTGFKNPKLQLLIYGKNIASSTPSLNYAGVTLEKVSKTKNPNYLFLDLNIAPATQPGTFELNFIKGEKTVASYKYQLRQRIANSSQRKGFDASDVIYLITPDRFANGDTTNDNAPGMIERVNRMNKDGRHGGDIKGIRDHLDYIRDLGFTAVWINPLLENNQETYSYHGYSITDYYKTDPRFGSNEDYFALAESIHKKGMKLIMDMVFNHCGSGHWWMKDLPSADWLNQFPEFTRTSYTSNTTFDPYVSKYDSIKFVKGWFDKTMPDLNQHNPFLARYLIQNSIWWIEAAGLDGIRQDTYIFCFKDFMSEWDREVLAEYPNFNIVGECWSDHPAGVAYWQKNALNKDHFNSMLPSVFDFPLCFALKKAFMEKDGWSEGILRIYEILAQDFSYPDPSHLVVFADSHDENRYFDTQGNDIRKVKMAMALILTTRGIPEIFYGTEILMTTGEDKGDGQKRKDFPGGWPGDLNNAFLASGRTAESSEMFSFLQNLLKWRQGKEVIHSGKLKQFIPQDGLYVYFRYNEKETVMVALNNNDTLLKALNPKIYSEVLQHFHSGNEVITGKQIPDLNAITVPPKSAIIVELKQ